MKTRLHMLQTYAAQITEPHLADDNPMDIIAQIEAECSLLKAFLFDVFNKGENNKVKEIFNWYHTHLIIIADALWNAIAKTKDIAAQALEKVKNVIVHMSSEYSLLLNDDNSLPLFETAQLKSTVQHKINEWKELLSEKNIKELLNLSLVKALWSYFKSNRYPALNYADKRYLGIILPQLQELVADERDKDWTKRLCQLLIKYNFNHMSVYKYLESENDKAFVNFRKPEDWLNFLYEKKIWIEQIMVIPGLAYSKDNESLKDLILKHLHAKAKFLKGKLKMGSLIKPRKFQRNLNVSELALDLHYRFYENEFGYKTKKEAAAAFCDSNSSKEMTDISPHSINKFDKLEQHDAALKLYQRYQRIVSKLAKDFDLRLW